MILAKMWSDVFDSLMMCTLYWPRRTIQPAANTSMEWGAWGKIEIVELPDLDPVATSWIRHRRILAKAGFI